jgi:hypothetical protein
MLICAQNSQLACSLFEKFRSLYTPAPRDYTVVLSSLLSVKSNKRVRLPVLNACRGG